MRDHVTMQSRLPLAEPKPRIITDVVLSQWVSCQVRKIAGCACAGNAGNVFPTTNFKRNCQLAITTCMTVCAPTRGGGKNVPGISGACAMRNFTHLARGSWNIGSMCWAINIQSCDQRFLLQVTYRPRRVHRTNNSLHHLFVAKSRFLGHHKRRRWGGKQRYPGRSRWIGNEAGRQYIGPGIVVGSRRTMSEYRVIESRGRALTSTQFYAHLKGKPQWYYTALLSMNVAYMAEYGEHESYILVYICMW